MTTRCDWPGDDPLMLDYHDNEWGVPVHDDRKLFEFLVLESAQAGLSWRTILIKRENYRRAFDDFDPVKVASYGDEDLARLLSDSGIVRNRLKLNAAIQNAKAFLAVQSAFGTFDKYIWSFVDGNPKTNTRKSESEIPTKSAESEAMSADLKKRGFRFVGPTIMYAHMQATGMVNDHLTRCFRYDQLR